MSNLLNVSVEQIRATVNAGKRLASTKFSGKNDAAKAKRCLIAIDLAVKEQLNEENLRKLYGRKTAEGKWILAGGKTSANVLQSFTRDMESTFPLLGWPDDLEFPAPVGGRGRGVSINPDIEFDLGSLEDMLAEQETAENPPAETSEPQVEHVPAKRNGRKNGV